MFVPIEVTVEQITNTVKNVDSRIIAVDLIDFFSKPEWAEKRSVTVRIIIKDPNKTLVKEEIDALYVKVIQALKKTRKIQSRYFPIIERSIKRYYDSVDQSGNYKPHLSKSNYPKYKRLRDIKKGLQEVLQK